MYHERIGGAYINGGEENQVVGEGSDGPVTCFSCWNLWREGGRGGGGGGGRGREREGEGEVEGERDSQLQNIITHHT